MRLCDLCNYDPETVYYYIDKSGKEIEIKKGTRFFALDRNGRLFEYVFSGISSGYERLLYCLDKTEYEHPNTFVARNWFSERYIEIIKP
jgi:hypothetical protein